MDKIKILLIEDEQYNIDLVKIYLRDKFEVDHAMTPESAIEKAGSNSYRIILMDIKLRGGKSGVELLNEIRELKNSRNCPVVATTAYAGKGKKEEYLSSGFDHYLGKPFSKEELLALLEDIIDN